MIKSKKKSKKTSKVNEATEKDLQDHIEKMYNFLTDEEAARIASELADKTDALQALEDGESIEGLVHDAAKDLDIELNEEKRENKSKRQNRRKAKKEDPAQSLNEEILTGETKLPSFDDYLERREKTKDTSEQGPEDVDVERGKLRKGLGLNPDEPLMDQVDSPQELASMIADEVEGGEWEAQEATSMVAFVANTGEDPGGFYGETLDTLSQELRDRGIVED